MPADPRWLDVGSLNKQAVVNLNTHWANLKDKCLLGLPTKDHP